MSIPAMSEMPSVQGSPSLKGTPSLFGMKQWLQHLGYSVSMMSSIRVNIILTNVLGQRYQESEHHTCSRHQGQREHLRFHSLTIARAWLQDRLPA